LIGLKLGPYEITAKLGEGGMGEVYRATDTKLHREVAIKVLPAAFTEDKERLQRFEREAQLLAQLHHPNIASIFGLEDSGPTKALVMELVDGPTLADRLEKGSLSIEESLSIARQIAEALEEAHEKGIVHRDLKPQNIKASIEGKVKVLDFGLAKAMDPVAGASGSASQLAQSPTLTLGATVQGVILGTAAYMSPEQAKGLPVDKRADIWAFGVVLFEMLTGARLFAADTVPETLAGVLKNEIDLDALPDETPSALRRLLRRCLERQPKRRLHDIADARIVIDEILAGDRDEVPGATPVGPAPSLLRRAAPWAVAALASVAAVVAWSGRSVATGSGSSAGYELALAPPADTSFAIGSNSGWGVVSPDGRQVVFPAHSRELGAPALWVRSLDRDDARPIPGTERGFYPFWSPDSRWVAYFVAGSLMKVEIGGGLPERISEAVWGRGGTWGTSGWILFNPAGGGAISRVRAEGGDAIPVTEVDESAGEDAHYWPVWLPGERSYLYFLRSTRRGDQGIYLGTIVDDGLDRSRTRVLATDASGLFAPAAPGRGPTLLWSQEGRLLARAFDPASGGLSGPVSEVAKGVRVIESQRATMASVSPGGVLVHASSAVGKLGIESCDRKGVELGPLPIARGDLHQLEVSPDGRRLAYVVVRDGQGDIWTHDFALGTSRAVSSSPEYEEQPIWSPDGREILFQKGGTSREYRAIRASVDGGVAPHPETIEFTGGSTRVRRLVSWLSADWALGLVQMEGAEEEALRPVRVGRPTSESDAGRALLPNALFAEYSPAVRGLAYVSNETGASEGSVVSLEVAPEAVRLGVDRQRVPVAGVLRLRWGPDGRELFALASDGGSWSIPVERRDGALHLGEPVRLFQASTAGIDFDVYEVDGEIRFLYRSDPEADRQTLTVITDWPARMKASGS